MPHKGYANLVMNDGPGFHSDVPVSELTECVTWATKASDVSSAPPVAETTDGVMHGTRPTPTEPNEALGLRSSDTDSKNQPISQVAGGTNMGGHPERQSAALGKEYQDAQPPTDSPVGCRLGGYPRGCARAHPLSKQKFLRWQHKNPPRRFSPNRPGLHPWVRSRTPAVKTKIPQTILPELPGGSRLLLGS